ncbi:hypothetical protein [Streptomyces sp. NPDC059916]|uniref:hypothetical protein n=1 Tax=Streptomyces sp. NPDC059916 TaxID=3347001 RepID=UPI0036A31B26
MTNSTETTSTPAAPAPVSYHWVMTVQFDHGRKTGTYNGFIDANPGRDTRGSMYKLLHQHMQQTLGVDQLFVLFFDLQPNQL